MTPTAGGCDVTDLEHQNNNIQIRDSIFLTPPFFLGLLKIQLELFFLLFFFIFYIKDRVFFVARQTGRQPESNSTFSCLFCVSLLDAIGKMISSWL